jgi:hypothetical protein
MQEGYFFSPNDAATATWMFLLQHSFYIPRSVLNPALCLNLNAMNKVDCQQYY